MFQAKVAEKSKIHNFIFKTDTIYGIMRKNMVEPDRPQRTIRMPSACWVHKATDTNSEYVIFIAFPRKQLLSERASMLCHNLLPVLCFKNNKSSSAVTFYTTSTKLQIHLVMANGNSAIYKKKRQRACRISILVICGHYS
jgi:hypothetical protein